MQTPSKFGAGTAVAFGKDDAVSIVDAVSLSDTNSLHLSFRSAVRQETRARRWSPSVRHLRVLSWNAP